MEESSSTIVMKELSDIKEKLATNTEATKNTSTTLTEIKQDLKVFQASFVTHEEFKPVSDKIDKIDTIVSRIVGALILSQVIVIPIVLYLFFKVIK